jgi:cysteine/glycine-rich protein
VEEDLSGAKDVTKTLKSQWEQQAEAEREGATPKRPEPRRSSQIDPSQFGGGDKCPVCEKTVYISERLELGDKAIHKTCLKCVACSMRLTVENYHTHADQFYCRQHYNEVHFGPSVPNPEVRLVRPAWEALRLLDRRALAGCVLAGAGVA